MAQADIDALKEELTRNTEVSVSIVSLVNTLAQRIEDAQDDPAELQAIAAELRNNTTSIAAAVTAHTPAEGENPVPTP